MDKWFIKKNISSFSNKIEVQKPIIDYKYFYLYWNNNNIHIGFYKNKPKNINFQKIIKWKQFNFNIIICGYIIQDNKKPINISNKNKSNINLNKKSISLLKSQLQKAIRRGELDISLMTAYEFYILDELSFLRRLSIIILEDVEYISIWFPIILWYIASYPLFKMSNIQIKYLLGFIKSLCLHKNYHKNIKESYHYFDIFKNLDKLNKNQRNCILSISLRSSYGGTKGDMNFIKGHAIQFKTKFLKNPHYYPTQIKVSPITMKCRLSYHNIMLPSADFHINPKILSLLNNKYPIYDKNIIKKTIWFNSSDINFRKNKNNIPFYNIWNLIKKDYDFLATKYINKVVTLKNF